MSQIFVGKQAVDFTSSAVMPDNEIDFEFSLRKYLDGSKGVLFFYPLDFTFVCPSEIISFHNKLGEFAARDTKVVAVSVDSHFSHLAWKNTPQTRSAAPIRSTLQTSTWSANYSRLSRCENTKADWRSRDTATTATRK